MGCSKLFLRRRLNSDDMANISFFLHNTKGVNSSSNIDAGNPITPLCVVLPDNKITGILVRSWGVLYIKFNLHHSNIKSVVMGQAILPASSTMILCRNINGLG